ncbi:MAG TPA: ATP-binding cassette domain-containing protein [Actinomycetota bacterium]|nr:ATP-binding cassette domain-containing protein [Actinomycetota bacterium]
MIRFEGVTFTYPRAASPALAGVDMTWGREELVLVAGVSGSGKSTLLRAANGLVPHFSGGTLDGRVTVAGLDTRYDKPRALSGAVGFVAQDPEGGSVASVVEDEIAFFLENLGLDPPLMRKRVEETLDALAIAHLRERALDSLSGGERQRVAIAAVLVAAPSVCVLDEPTSMLDPQSAEEVLQSVLRLSHEMGLGIVLSEHRLERVLAFADRVCVVEEGRVRIGPVRDMLADSPVAPPVVRLARALGWTPVPVSVREARARAASLDVHPGRAAAGRPAPGGERIAVKNLSVALGGREVVRDLDLSVREGETVAVVGRNGAGKTTVLRAILGLVRRVRGAVLLDGAQRDSVEDAATVAAYVPQAASRTLTRARSIDEIERTLRRKGVRDPLAPVRILDDWGLSAFAERDPRDLSAGEATRLALAAATAHDPGIVLLDEPTRGMDEPEKHRLAERLAAWRHEGRAVVMVTHDVELIAEAATRVVLLADGEAVVDGPARSVLGESVMFSSQMNKVFEDRRIATVADAVAAVTP